LDKVWGYDYSGNTRTVNVHIRWLRRKIETDSAHPRNLLTVRGVGYKLEAILKIDRDQSMAGSTLKSRIRKKALLSKVGVAEDVTKLIKDEITLGIPTGDQSGCPKTFLRMLREEISRRNSNFNVRLYTVGPAPAIDEDILTLPNVHGRKYGQLTSRGLKRAVNKGTTSLVEIRVSLPHYQLKQLCRGKMDLAVIESVGVTEEGHIIPSTALLDGPSYAALADKIVIEINPNVPMQIEGMHDVYLLQAPPNRAPIPITHVYDRIGTPYIQVDPEKIALIIESSEPEITTSSRPTDKESKLIAEHLLDFLTSEIERGKLPTSLFPLQFGIGTIPTAVTNALASSSFTELEFFSGSLGDGVLDLVDAGKIKTVSTGGLYFSKKGFDRFFEALVHYKRYIILRTAEIANCPELISRLGVIAVNGALEVDIYGNINSTHVFGSRSIGGIGGSCDFAWNAYASIFLLRSTIANGSISTIVPMVTHVDHPEHAVDVIGTEQGLVDVRGLSPVERAWAIITNCAHPNYRPMLTDYLERSIKTIGGHEPHLLNDAFSLHHRFVDKGTMLA